MPTSFRHRTPRVLITGGAGFLGSHLSERFLKEGWDVVALDNFFTGSRDNVRHLLSHNRPIVLFPAAIRPPARRAGHAEELKMTAAMEADLRAQGRAFIRAGYDGHNRKPQQQSMRHIKMRQGRRRWRAFMRQRVEWLETQFA